MKVGCKEIVIGSIVKVTFNGITEEGSVKSMTPNGFWFTGDKIDQFLFIRDIHPDFEYITGNKLHLDYNGFKDIK